MVALAVEFKNLSVLVQFGIGMTLELTCVAHVLQICDSVVAAPPVSVLPQLASLAPPASLQSPAPPDQQPQQHHDPCPKHKVQTSSARGEVLGRVLHADAGSGRGSTKKKEPKEIMKRRREQAICIDR